MGLNEERRIRGCESAEAFEEGRCAGNGKAGSEDRLDEWLRGAESGVGGGSGWQGTNVGEDGLGSREGGFWGVFCVVGGALVVHVTFLVRKQG